MVRRLEVVGQMFISWIPSLERWVMIYGGGLSEQFGALIFGDDWKKLDWSKVGPLYVRSSAQPWGPWTAPKALLVAGDANAATGLYKPGGILYSAKCADTTTRVKSEKAWGNPGGLYAPNIIEPWTEERQDAVDLYWNLSTWNPYEVVLMKSRIALADVL